MRGDEVRRLVILGGGPSGMASALEAVREGAEPIVLERLDRVGGLARTIEHAGNRFDIGPHRFFTLNPEIKQLFEEVCGDDIIKVPRLTRIYYKGVFFDYPLTPLNALFGLGIWNSIGVGLSYAMARLRRMLKPMKPESFEEWIVDKFGSRLYRTFFKTYTEKVWGIPCTRIGADWAEQRIKGLSLTAAVKNALFKPKKKTIKTLVDEFMYPRLGAGQLYRKMQDMVTAGGGEVRTGAQVSRVKRDGFRVTGIEYRDEAGQHDLRGDFYLSSVPLTELLDLFDPPPPPEIVKAARELRYRHHIGVKLVVKGTAPFADNWIYVHSPDVKMARISDYQNFSKEMGATPDSHPLTVEYFCFADDEIWNSSDADLVKRAIAELATMGINVDPATDGFCVRSEKAYPVIERGFAERIETIKAYLDQFENLLPIGRSGMFKYNNQDHAMATGLYATRTALGKGQFDPWLVNIDGVYHEGGAVA